MKSLLKSIRAFAERQFLKLAARTVSPGARTSARCVRDFSAFRKRWWIQWKLEPATHLWRYMWLVEKARALNEADRHESRDASEFGPGKLCVIQFGHLGDVLHTVPMLRAARRAFPNATIRLLTGPWNRSVAERISYVDEVRYYAPMWDAYVRGRYADCLSLRQEWRFLLDLRAERFDGVVDATSGSLPTSFCMLAMRPRRGVGPDLFPAAAFETPPSWFQAIPYASRAYEARRILQLLEPWGVSDANDRLEFLLTEKDRREAEQILTECGLSDTNGYALLAPGAGWPGKMWPADRFAHLARRMVSELHMPVAVVGAAWERSLGGAIASEAGEAVRILAGRTSIGALAALMSRCKVLVTNDSGPYHLAVALNVPTVLLFGPGFPSKWVADRKRQRVLHHEVGCRCFPWHPRARCEYDRACMKAISTDEVWQAVQEVLA